MNLQTRIIATLIVIYLILFAVEQKWPLRQRKRALLQRIRINFSFTILVYLIASLLITPLAKYTVNLSLNYQFGILAWLPLNNTGKFICGFLLLDLTFYYWHRMNHEISLLWRFHNVHHVDPDLDVTTSMRFHVVEIAYSSLFRVLQLGLIGANVWLLFCYEFAFQANTFFQHSNIKLPFRLEKIVNKILVTPRMHGIHHSYFREETNRNYGVVFTFWDKLHGTILLNVPQNAITIGVPAYQQASDNTFINLLLMPFQSQRKYWHVENKTYINRPEAAFDKSISELAE